jgi:hypothetical protein
VQRAIPFFFGQVDDVLADRYASAIAEDVDVAPLANRRFNGAAAVGGTLNITIEKNRFPTLVLDFGYGLASIGLVNVEYGDERSHFGKAQRDAMSDARCGAGDDRDFVFERKQLRSLLRDLLHFPCLMAAARHE